MGSAAFDAPVVKRPVAVAARPALPSFTEVFASLPPPRALSKPDRQPSRPYLLANGSALHLVWKEFDGDKVVVRWQVSRDSGKQWSETRTVAETADASDHPLLVADRQRTYLSWLTKNEGYRLIPLGDQP
jgi:hypothetical protein